MHVEVYLQFVTYFMISSIASLVVVTDLKKFFSALFVNSSLVKSNLTNKGSKCYRLQIWAEFKELKL